MGLCLCVWLGFVAGLCLCGLALLLGCVCVWLCCWVDVCVCVCGCGDGFGWVDRCIMRVCCVLNRCWEGEIKMAVEKPRKMRLNGWEEIIKNGLKNNILIKIEFWDVEVL